MLVKPHEADRVLARIDPAIRLYLFGGADDSANRAMRDKVAASLGAEAERVDVTQQRVKEDPALLADEAASISLFGGTRWVSLTIASGGGDDMAEAVQNLLSAPAAGNPVVMTVAGLTAKSKLTKLADTSKAAVVVVTYEPDARSSAKSLGDVAEALGLQLDRDTTRAVSEACSHDRGLIAQELTKLALYVDATPEAPRRAGMADWHAIGAGIAEEDMGDAINATFGGNLKALAQCLADLGRSGTLDIGLVRAMAIRAQLLARLRVDVEAGQSPSRVIEAQGKAIFWKEKEAVTRQLERWTAPRLAQAIVALHRLERDLKSAQKPGELLVRQTMLNFARFAARG